MKTYMVNFNALTTPTHELLSYFDTQPAILNWYTPFAGAIIIVSDWLPAYLASMIGNRFPGHHFVIAEINAYNTDGRMPAITWDFINNPKSSGRWGLANPMGTGALSSLMGTSGGMGN